MFRGRSADPPAADTPTVDPTVDTPTVDTAAKVAALARIVESIAGGGRPT
jgi:hypothetical protein